MASAKDKIFRLKQTECILEHCETAKPESRDKTIIKTSILGIVANLLLAALKAFIGLMTNSIAILLDAVNNTSDAASSVITIVGTKLACKPADKKHPFGYGRIEYLSAIIIAIIVLYAGVTSLTESVKKILEPETPEYTTVSLILVAAGVLVKFFLGRYVKAIGKKVNSDSLVNSGEDAKLDSIISTSTLVAAIVFIACGVSLEAWLGAIISLVIIKAGLGMMKETLSQLLGERADTETARKVTKTVKSFPEVKGVFDLILNNYGPDTFNGSVHIEVEDTLSMERLDALLRDITMKVLQEHNILLTGIGIYSVNTKNEKAVQMRQNISRIALAEKEILQVHGFYLDEALKMITFDLVVCFESKNREAVFQKIVSEVQKAYPDYTINAVMDTDFSVSD